MFHSAKNFKNLSFCKSFVRAGSRTARQCILMFIHRKRRSLSLSTDAFFYIQNKNNKNYQGYKHLEMNEDTKGPYLI